MQINELPTSYTFASDDIIVIEINNVTYKLTGATLASALKAVGNYLVTGDVANNLTTTTAGKVLDARQGKALNDSIATKQDALTFDAVPTDGSTNPVESNGIYDALALKLNTANVYNGLDKTDAGYALDARQGKVLKDGQDELTSAVNDISDDVAGLIGSVADKADVIIDTASGAIASFPDGMAAPAKDITIGIEPVQAGSGDPSPTNVRPISGWTGANVSATGKNILDHALIENKGFNTENGQRSNNPYRLSNVPIMVAGGHDLTVSINDGFYMATAMLYDKDGNYIGFIGVTWTEHNHTYHLPENARYFTTNFKKIDESECSPSELQVQIEYGSTATSYEPYTGNTYLISWQSEAGTVYGGTLDVVNGVLTVEWVKQTFDGSSDENWYPWGWGGGYRYLINISPLCSGVVTDIKFNYLVTLKSISDQRVWGGKIYASDIIDTYWPTPITTVSELRAYLASNNLEAVYKLSTPQTYQLTPTEVEMLLGENNVWADTGDSTVTYRADTKLYIQKINAPTDDDMIADTQIASGKYFIVGGNLYKSTTTIPAGDTITPRSNCILTNLADALNALNT